jgi:hypothetical protein
MNEDWGSEEFIPRTSRREFPNSLGWAVVWPRRRNIPPRSILTVWPTCSNPLQAAAPSAAAAPGPSSAESCASASAFPIRLGRVRRPCGFTLVRGLQAPAAAPRSAGWNDRPFPRGPRARSPQKPLTRTPPAARRRRALSERPGQMPQLPRADRPRQLAHPRGVL